MMFPVRVVKQTLLLGVCTLLPFGFAHAQSTEPLTDAQVLSALDPDMAKVIHVFDSIKGTPIVNLTPQDARQQFGAEDAAKIVARQTGAAPQPMPVGKVADGLMIPGPDSTSLPIRLYTPKGAGPFPVVVYFHGGGFVIATNDTYDASARAICDYAGAIVVAVEYRKAPEAPFPAALNDAVAGYQWTVNNIDRYQGIPGKIAVMGESAGGNLATEVAIAARDRGLQRPTAQVLVYPITSSNLNQPSDKLYTSSLLPLSTPALPYFSKLYLDMANPNDPDVAPINAPLQGLAPATIIAAELDPLRSDGQAYAAKLKEAGTPVTYMLYTGVTHEFFGMGAVVSKAGRRSCWPPSSWTSPSSSHQETRRQGRTGLQGPVLSAAVPVLRRSHTMDKP